MRLVLYPVRPLPQLVAALSLFLAACQSQPPAAPAAPPISAPPPAAATSAPAAQPTSGAAATATQGGTVIIGLDQEPPTMDPEASPSAITFT